MRWRAYRAKVAAVVLAARMVACQGATEPRSTPGIHVTATLVDTVFARHPLTVLIRNDRGVPARKVVLVFEAVPGGFPVLVAAADSQFTTRLIDTTDARGTVSVLTRLGTVVGQEELAISVPDLGLADTVRFTVEPGAAAGVSVVPTDTAIYAGHGFTLRGTATDVFGNPRGEPVSYAVVYGPVTADPANGAVTATTIGRAAVVALAVGHVDTAYVSVVPPAWVATEQGQPFNTGSLGLFLVQLDGSGGQFLAPQYASTVGPAGFGWSPDGQLLAIARASVNLLRPGGVEQPLVQMSGPLSASARFSRDGRWVYFALARGTLAQPQGLYRVGIDSTGLELLGPGGPDYFPAPSHDGQSLAYVSDRTPCDFVGSCIRVMDLTTRQDRVYGARDYLALGTQVAWSPIEDLIAYGARPSLVLVHADGTGARTLADNLYQVRWMDWSPDGRWLVVAADNGVELFDVQTGLRLPVGQLRYNGATAWRP